MQCDKRREADLTTSIALMESLHEPPIKWTNISASSVDRVHCAGLGSADLHAELTVQQRRGGGGGRSSTRWTQHPLPLLHPPPSSISRNDLIGCRSIAGELSWPENYVHSRHRTKKQQQRTWSTKYDIPPHWFRLLYLAVRTTRNVLEPGNRTIRRPTNSRSVKSRTACSPRGPVNSPQCLL